MMGQVEDAIAFARAQIGKPYKFGTAGPDTFDCSGLIVAAYGHATPPITLPHWTGALILVGKEVARGELQPGDLVFPDSGHVQLYIGNNQMVEAPHEGARVREGPLYGFWRGRRLVASSGGAANTTSLPESILGALKELPGPLSAGAELVDVLRPLGVAAINLSNPQFWARIGMGGLGVAFLITGLLYLNRRPLERMTGLAVGAAGSVVGAGVQGAAFGFGAGKSGGLATSSPAPATAILPARRTPKAPPAVAPATVPTPAAIKPRSAPLEASQSPGGTFNVTAVGVAKAPPRPLPGFAGSGERKRKKGGPK